MTAGTTGDAFLSAWKALEASGAFAGPPWLRDRRREAIARFTARGLPTSRDEEWKYTSLAPITAAGLDAAADGGGDEPAEEALAPEVLSGPWPRLVFVDGRYSPKLSAIGPLPRGARIESMAGALITDPDMLRPHLHDSGAGEDGFDALNAAFWRDGALLQVPTGAVMAEPVHLLFVTTGATRRVEHPRSLVVVGAGSRVTLIESHVALGGNAPGLTNATVDIDLGEGAVLERYTVQRASGGAFEIGRTRVRQARGSGFRSCAVTFDGRLVRNETEVRLGGETASCALEGLFVIGGRQHVDTRTVVDHAAPRATSRQLYKGILDGRARGVFNGRVIVRPGAVGTDAHQTNKNLLLSDEVEVDSKPQLEIFADDVKCSHGAADGQVAEDGIFYLRSRGLDETSARALLTLGFANEVLGRIDIGPLRARLEAFLASRLNGGRVAAEPEPAGKDTA
jgi:Fe-S cluster assembly protein SufD